MMTIEQAQQLADFLMGNQPPGEITLSRRPRKMTAAQAFGVIYVLQEAFHVIPDTFEMCSGCKCLFDSEEEGHIPDSSEKYYCDSCSGSCRCKECRRGRSL